MKAFISTLLGYDPKSKELEGGILGLVKGYYGCVEAQGRGTLHCHMLVWVEGGLNPNEIRDRAMKQGSDFQKQLLAFLDDTISNSIPPDPDPEMDIPSSKHHPCTVRGVNFSKYTDHEVLEKARLKDLHHLAKKCQSHEHSKTCYKYWKGPPNPKECRFDLDQSNVCLESSFDAETGELSLRCLDGMVNNFNATIMEAVRCNMDIKFIGSGASAKAILYYITDYITKSQLKTHVAFAALELAIAKLGEFSIKEDDVTARAKRLLQRCAYAMISHQELSAQQVCSYLMDFEDHFTSHTYRNIYWTSVEYLINKSDPSPECYQENKSTAATEPSSSSESTENSDSIPDNIVDNSEDIVEDEEVQIKIADDGQVQACGGQALDYSLRGDAFRNICL
ncbi:uncharacterized protein STEHIDRAFT_30578, partial [Stereum hirsutum FP-91666 SS1]|uniref:uncharacterized protein n=1 Tax=Stereum hirsutum (strain FP-91666) TaxID=721885 RepID=UPI0004449B85